MATKWIALLLLYPFFAFGEVVKYETLYHSFSIRHEGDVFHFRFETEPGTFCGDELSLELLEIANGPGSFLDQNFLLKPSYTYKPCITKEERELVYQSRVFTLEAIPALQSQIYAQIIFPSHLELRIVELRRPKGSDDSEPEDLQAAVKTTTKKKRVTVEDYRSRRLQSLFQRIKERRYDYEAEDTEKPEDAYMRSINDYLGN